MAAAALGDTVVRQIDDAGFRRAVLAGYPDRVARRRDARSDRFVMASGTGARQARESGVYDAEFVAAVDVTGGASGAEALMRLVTGLDREWLEATASRRPPRAQRGIRNGPRVPGRAGMTISCCRSNRWRPIPPSPPISIADELLRRPPRAEDDALLRRLRFAGIEVTYADLVRRASAGARRLSDVDVEAAVAARRQARARRARA